MFFMYSAGDEADEGKLDTEIAVSFVCLKCDILWIILS